MKKIIIWCAAAGIAGLAIIGYLFVSGKEVKIELTEDQIQKAIDKKFPVEKESAGGLLKVKLCDPKVILHNGSDKIEFSCRAETNVNVKDQPLAGEGIVTGKIQYIPHAGEFRLQQSKIRISIDRLPEKFNKPLSLLADKIAGDYLDDHPIYTLKETQVAQKAAKLFLQSVVVKDGSMHITLGIN